MLSPRRRLPRSQPTGEPIRVTLRGRRLTGEPIRLTLRGRRLTGEPIRNSARFAGFPRLVRRRLGLIALALAAAASCGVATVAAATAVGLPASTTVTATTPTTSTPSATSTTSAPTGGTSGTSGGTSGTGTSGTGTSGSGTGTSGTGTSTTVAGSTTSPPSAIAVPAANPFADRGMWIWQMSQTDSGNIAEIIATAEHYGIGTLLIKSSDGSTPWSQFNSTLVTDLHEAGLKVCAWQFVYGVHPVAEARLGARAVRDGADCLVIDAETAYQGKYVAASTYVSTLRKLIGRAFPLGLAGFPYVDYHLNFPYSVFLGPGGAQYNLPQMYWADIGVSVSTVFQHTYEWNEIYQRPIYPLGQLFGRLSATAIEQFNTLATDYGAAGVNWWDWQAASLAYFADIDTSTSPPYGFMLNRAAVTLSRKAVGDPVVWAQQHLVGAGYPLVIDGSFQASTQNAVESFQSAHGLPVTGQIDAATWIALDAVKAVTVRWVHRKRGNVAIVASVTPSHSRRPAPQVTEPVPTWVGATRDRNELHGEPGAGRP